MCSHVWRVGSHFSLNRADGTYLLSVILRTLPSGDQMYRLRQSVPHRLTRIARIARITSACSLIIQVLSLQSVSSSVAGVDRFGRSRTRLPTWPDAPEPTTTTTTCAESSMPASGSAPFLGFRHLRVVILLLPPPSLNTELIPSSHRQDTTTPTLRCTSRSRSLDGFSHPRRSSQSGLWSRAAVGRQVANACRNALRCGRRVGAHAFSNISARLCSTRSKGNTSHT